MLKIKTFMREVRVKLSSGDVIQVFAQFLLVPY